MAKEYLKDFDKIIKADKKKIKESDLTPKNKELILKFIDEYKVIKGLQPPTVHKHLYQLRVIGETLGKDFDAVMNNKKEIIKVISTLEDKDLGEGRKYSAGSIYDYKKSLKVFYRWLYGKGKSYPPCVEWINLTNNPHKDRLPETILTKEEILRLVSTAINSRDKALIYSLWESGQRVNVFLTRRLKHLIFDNKGCKIAFLRHDKTHEIWLRLVECTAFMAAWVNSHPDRDNPDAPLWVNIIGKKRGKRLDYSTLLRMLQQVAAKAKIKKKVNPHAFRHSRATFLAKYMTDMELKHYFGWVKDSSMVKKYVHLSGRDIEDKILKISGIKTEEQENEENNKARECFYCHNPNSSLNKWCATCGRPLDEKAAVKMMKEEQLINKVMNKIFGDEEKKKKFMELIKE